jgi:hypothetical protein
MDDWASSVRQLSTEYPLAWLPIVTFVIITAFVVVNLIIAVICDAISALHEDDKAKLHGTFESDEDQDTQSGSSESKYSLRKDLHTQLDGLEENVNELMRMQEETMFALRGLADYIAEKQQRQSARKQRPSISTRRSSDTMALRKRRRKSDLESSQHSPTTVSIGPHSHEGSSQLKGSF